MEFVIANLQAFIVLGFVLFVFFIVILPIWLFVDCLAAKHRGSGQKLLWVVAMIIGGPPISFIYGIIGAQKNWLRVMSGIGLALILLLAAAMVAVYPTVKDKLEFYAAHPPSPETVQRTLDSIKTGKKIEMPQPEKMSDLDRVLALTTRLGTSDLHELQPSERDQIQNVLGQMQIDLQTDPPVEARTAEIVRQSALLQKFLADKILTKAEYGLWMVQVRHGGDVIQPHP